MKKGALVLGIASLLVLGACGNKASAKKTQSIKMMASDVIASMDSAQATDFVSLQIQTDTFAGLFRYDGSKLKPDMATAKATVSKDQKTYTFHLRHGAKWTDGKEVTASDFEYAWKRVVKPSTKSAYAYIFSGIENADDIIAGKKDASTLGITAKGKYTLVVKLDRVMPYFESMLTLPVFNPVEKSYVEKVGKKYATSSKYLHSNGPYTLKNWSSSNNAWTETKNATYWNAKHQNLTSIKYQVVKDSSTAMNLYNSGKLDDVSLTGTYAQQSKGNKDYNIVKQPTVSYLKFNTKAVPVFKNAKIRQAISLCLNRKSFINNVLGDGSTVAKTMVPTGMFYNEKTGKDFGTESAKGVESYTSYDLAKAKKLFKEGMAEAGVTTLDFTLLSNDQDSTKSLVEYLQNSIEKLATGNLKVKITNKAVPTATWLSLGSSFDYGMMLRNWVADFPDAINFLSLFESKTENFSGNWNSATYDKLINASDTTDSADVSKRWSDLLEANQTLTKDMGVVPLYQWGTAHLTNTSVKGLKYGPNSIRNYSHVVVK